MNKFSNLPDIILDPFYELYNIVSSINQDQTLKASIELYINILDSIQSRCIKKRERNMSVYLIKIDRGMGGNQ